MSELWTAAADALEAGHPTRLVAVVDAEGSVPGTPGAMMAVWPEGAAGTVGGGIAERDLMERARTLAPLPALLDFDHSGCEADSLCSGRQVFAVVALDPAQLPTVHSIRNTLSAGGMGRLRLSDVGLDFAPGQRAARRFERDGATWVFEDTIGRRETLFIVGGGHVALALSRIMATLPFRIVVLDDRPAVATMLRNRWAHERRTVDYGTVAAEVGQGDDVYVVIMTHGHTHDERALEALLGHHVRYLGMMGSRAKSGQVLSNLAARGVPRAVLDRVHTPIGAPIGSHTPEEIAISIAAEILAVRAGAPLARRLTSPAP